VGITATAGSTVTLEATLWHDNGVNFGSGGDIVTGTAILTGTVDVYGDPAFVDPPTWDYHLTAESAAIDEGMDAGVATDIDGESRDAKPDIGADEFSGDESGWQIYLPLVVRQ
jgi:hypothetical protein